MARMRCCSLNARRLDARTETLALLSIDLGDRLGFVRAGRGKADPVAGMQAIQRHPASELELLRRAAGIRTDGAILPLPDRDRVIQPVDSDDGSGARLLGEGRR